MIKRTILLLAICLMFSSCATFGKKDSILKNHDDDYLQSANLPPLKAPPGIHIYTQDPYYVIPYSGVRSGKYISILPPGSYAAKQEQAKAARGAHAKG